MGFRVRAAVGVLVGPCCPALLNCIDADVHTVVLLLGKDNDDADDDDDAVIMTKVIGRVHPVHLMGLGLGSSRAYGMIWRSKCQFI